MIANIRVRDSGYSKPLCQLDLMRFSEERVRERLVALGYDFDSDVTVVSIVDWQVDRVMTLQEAYLLKKVILEVYDGDNYIVVYQLQKNIPIWDILTNFYQFLSEDAKEAMIDLIGDAGTKSVITLISEVHTWANFVQVYVDRGFLLNTPKGFYRQL